MNICLSIAQVFVDVSFEPAFHTVLSLISGRNVSLSAGGVFINASRKCQTGAQSCGTCM